MNSQRLEFTYQATVEKPSVGEVRLWVPFPIEDSEQRVISYKIKTSPAIQQAGQVTTEKAYGNKMLYFVLPAKEFVDHQPVQIEVTYQLERHPGKTAKLGQLEKKPALSPDLYMRENPWLKSNETIREMAMKAIAGANSDQEKIRGLYDHVYDLMTYNKDGKGWGRGDPVWACTAKRGNCTDFHSLLIAMGRQVGVAGRFEIGVPIPSHLTEGEIPGYHCWARMYDRDHGWLPVDASEAKKAGARDKYFGLIPSDRVAFSVGRNLTLEPPQAGGGLNFFIYPYAEAGGVPHTGLQQKFSFRRL